MKKQTELVAIALILLAFSSGMVLTAATSGCDSGDPANNRSTTAALRGPAQSLTDGVGWKQD